MPRQDEIRAKLEARRAGEMTAWGGAKRSPENAKRILVAGLECGESGSPKGGRDDSLGGAKRSPRNAKRVQR